MWPILARIGICNWETENYVIKLVFEIGETNRFPTKDLGDYPS